MAAISSLIQSVICNVSNQKRQLSLYNVPPQRFNLTSPYPKYTSFQLDMRRKIEILKYNNSKQNTKTNNFTKKQKFAYLANNISSRLSQSVIAKSKITVCNVDKTIPTSSTKCNIPGPPIILQYDPSVPLYNYINDRVYSIANEIKDIYSFYTKNSVVFTDNYPYIVYPDTNTLIQTRSETIGVLIINSGMNELNYSIPIKIPISIWFSGSIGCGYDAYGNLINNTPVISSDYINIHIINATINLYYNNNISQSLNVNSQNLLDCSFNLTNVNEQFYAIQFIGMIEQEIIINNSDNTIYNVELVFNYNYNNTNGLSKLDFFQTGIYANLSNVYSSNYIHNCVLNSLPATNYSKSSFVQYEN
jgi:hypothetical protein